VSNNEGCSAERLGITPQGMTEIFKGAANAEIQSRVYFGCFDRPDDIDRADIYRVVGFFKNSVFVPSLNTLFRVG
jgi:hypothetical protein